MILSHDKYLKLQFRTTWLNIWLSRCITLLFSLLLMIEGCLFSLSNQISFFWSLVTLITGVWITVISRFKSSWFNRDVEMVFLTNRNVTMVSGPISWQKQVGFDQWAERGRWPGTNQRWAASGHLDCSEPGIIKVVTDKWKWQSARQRGLVHFSRLIRNSEPFLQIDWYTFSFKLLGILCTICILC